MLRRELLRAALAVGLATRHGQSSAASAPALPPTPSVAPATTSANAPTFAAASLPTPLRVPVWLEGRGPFSFIVDTGASRTALAAHCLPELPRSTSREQQVRLQTPGGSVDVPTVAVTAMRVGDREDALRLDARRLPVLPRQALTTADGLLGADALAGECLTIDFVAGTVVLAARVPVARRARHAQSRLLEVPVDLDAVGRAFVTVRFGARDVRALLDTGALRSIAAAELLHDAASATSSATSSASVTGATAQLPAATPPAPTTELRSAAGTLLQGAEALLPAFRIGARRWPAAPVIVAPLPAVALGAVGLPGGAGERSPTLLLLGLDRLAALERLTLDYARARLTLSPLRAGRG